MFAEYIDLVQKKSYVINIDKTEKTSMDNNKTVFLANAGGGGGGRRGRVVLRGQPQPGAGAEFAHRRRFQRPV